MDTQSDAKPNVLIFMTDQQNGWTIREGKKTRAITPHLDIFRKKAVSFTNAYSPSPHCCPSRVSFFSSLYPSEHGVWNNVNVSNALTRGPREGVEFWTSSYAKAGYQLGFSGKWHVSNWQRPIDFGWQELKVTSPGFGTGPDLAVQRDEARKRELKVVEFEVPMANHKRTHGEVVRPGWPKYVHFGTDEDPCGDAEVVDHGVDFISEKKNSSDPWCLYVGTVGPHDPYTPPKRFLDWYDLDDIELPTSFGDEMEDKPGLYRRTRDRFDQLTEAEHRDALRHYMAFCSYEDELFGRLIAELESTKQLDNTIVVFLSDHGDYAAEHGLWGKGLPAFQSAYRIPLVIGGPGIASSRFDRECDTPISLVDLGPTLLDLCQIPKMTETSGNSRAAWLNGTDGENIPTDTFFQSNGNEAYGIQRAVVSNGWKLVYNMFDQDELYDLSSDKNELVNLISTVGDTRRLGKGPLDAIPVHLRDRVEDLYSKLWRFSLSHSDENINDYILTALAPFGPGIVNGSKIQNQT